MSNKETFLSSTIGLMASHENLNRPMLIRVEFYEVGNSVKVKAVNGNSLSVIKSIRQVLIPREQYSNRDHDPYNDIVECRWAFNLLGIQ